MIISKLIGLIALALNIIAISDVLTSKKRSIGEKVVLIVLILLLQPGIGAGLYLFAFRDRGE
jgi:hypothetical protein